MKYFANILFYPLDSYSIMEKMFVVYFSDDEFNWRMKYLMIYLTKQIVQLPLGFVYFYFALFFARKPLFLVILSVCMRISYYKLCDEAEGNKLEKLYSLSFEEILNYWKGSLCWLHKMYFGNIVHFWTVLLMLNITWITFLASLFLQLFSLLEWKFW